MRVNKIDCNKEMFVRHEQIGVRHPLPPHIRGDYTLPPHLRKDLFKIDYDEQDIEFLMNTFRDEDTINAVFDIINTSPPEMKVLLYQFVKLKELLNKDKSMKSEDNFLSGKDNEEPSLPHFFGSEPMRSPHVRGKLPLPKHVREGMLFIDFDTEDKNLLTWIYGSKEKADEAIFTIRMAPPEKNVIVCQIFELYNFLNKEGKIMHYRFDSPVVDQEAKKIYEDLYGQCGERMLEIMESAPQDNAVISRIIASITLLVKQEEEC